MSNPLKNRGKALADVVARARERARPGDVEELRARVDELEAEREGRRGDKRRATELAARVEELEGEVQECRKLNLRLAELTDVVQELLLPAARRDQAHLEELLERYTETLG